MTSTGHLCSGYDGLGLALDEVEPHDVLWHSEIDPAMSRILAREHPDVPNAGNLVDLLLDDLWRLAPAPDLLTAGFPCQPVSAAGRMLADLDPRWLWPFVREVYRQTRPFRLFLENVQNLVSIQGGAILRGILGDLREDGYAARWVVVGACAVGAPHHRHRWFLVADYVGAHAPEAVRINKTAICGAPRSGGRFLLPTPAARDHKSGNPESRLARGLEPWDDLPSAVRLLPTPRSSDAKGPGTGRMADGKAPWDDLPTTAVLLPTPQARDARDAGLSSPAYAQQRLDSGRRNLDDAVAAALLPTPMAQRSGSNRGGAGGRGDDQPIRHSLDSVHHLLPTPRATDVGTPGRRSSDGWRPQLGQAVLPMLPTPRASDGERGRGNCSQVYSSGAETLGAAAHPDRWGKYWHAVALWEHLTGVPAPEPTEPGANGAPRLSALLPEWMMGLQPGYLTKELTRAEALRGAGNGVVPWQAAAAYRLLTS